jgi:hypothetical protein
VVFFAAGLAVVFLAAVFLVVVFFAALVFAAVIFAALVFVANAGLVGSMRPTMIVDVMSAARRRESFTCWGPFVDDRWSGSLLSALDLREFTHPDCIGGALRWHGGWPLGAAKRARP